MFMIQVVLICCSKLYLYPPEIEELKNETKLSIIKFKRPQQMFEFSIYIQCYTSSQYKHQKTIAHPIEKAP